MVVGRTTIEEEDTFAVSHAVAGVASKAVDNHLVVVVHHLHHSKEDAVNRMQWVVHDHAHRGYQKNLVPPWLVLDYPFAILGKHQVQSEEGHQHLGRVLCAACCWNVEE